MKMTISNFIRLVVALVVCDILSSSGGTFSPVVYALSVVTFNNGSTLTLRPKLFERNFYSMNQTGISPARYTWRMSLITSSNFSGACTHQSHYLAMGMSCQQVDFNSLHTATPNIDGSGVQLIYKSVDTHNKMWQASVNVICDLSSDLLSSPSNSYHASQVDDTIVVAWTLTSMGACLNYVPPPTSPSPSPSPTTLPPSPTTPSPPPSPPTITFSNGSTLVLQEKYFTTATTLQQKGVNPSLNNIFFSLATPSTFYNDCAKPMFVAMGTYCNYGLFPNAAYSATPNEDGSGIQLIYKSTTINGKPTEAALNIICDPAADTLYSPSGAYIATQSSTDLILSFRLASKGACLPPLTLAPPTFAPPTPSPPWHSIVTFTNGSIVILNEFFFNADFGWMEQTGLVQAKNDVEMSLFNPSNFDGTCRVPSYISLNRCTGPRFPDGPLFVIPNNEGTGIVFTFSGTPSLIWQANINVICDPRRGVLTSPTDSYQTSHTKLGEVILTWNLTSRGACINQNY